MLHDHVYVEQGHWDREIYQLLRNGNDECVNLPAYTCLTGA